MKVKPIPNTFYRSVLIEKKPIRVRLKTCIQAITSHTRNWKKNEFFIHKCVSFEEFYRGLEKAGKYKREIFRDYKHSDFYVISSGKKKGYLIYKAAFDKINK
jgi:hypothetical protein